MSLRRHVNKIQSLIGIVLAIILLYYVFREVEWEKLKIHFTQLNPVWTSAAVIAICLNFFLRSMRWQILLVKPERPRIIVTFAANMIGYMGNNFLPARAGEVLRCIYLGRHSFVGRSFSFATVITERVYDTAFLGLAGVIVLAFISGIPDWLTGSAKILSPIAVALFLFSLSLPWFEPAAMKLTAKIKRLKLRNRIESMLSSGIDGFGVLKSPIRFLAYNLITFIIWSLDVLIVLILIKALGFSLPVSGAILLIVALAFASAAPSTPGYLGIYQFVAVEILPIFGLSKEQALATILVFQGLIYLTVVMLGLPSLLWLSSGNKTNAATSEP
ncbi:MAG: flippase-like domain-containing protein [Leptospiraceae bacterium]|nr:flippase-like domain-containing protein [Leptospiraceae bacterium]